mmetsp:Transcript_13769/g.20784  ORF Transcript_13769/g.20784 Transcript_13769/m.20784 type:complete len:260 (+) Transcript_13769:185-964(+)
MDDIRIICRTQRGSKSIVNVSKKNCRTKHPKVQHLKQAIASELKHHMQGVWTMHLYYNSKDELEDSKQLEEYGIKDLSTISIVIKQAQFIRIHAASKLGKHSMVMSSCATVKQFKNIFERKCSLPGPEDVLLQVKFDGKVLEDEETLSSIGIKDGSKLDVTIARRMKKMCSSLSYRKRLTLRSRPQRLRTASLTEYPTKSRPPSIRRRFLRALKPRAFSLFSKNNGDCKYTKSDSLLDGLTESKLAGALSSMRIGSPRL